MVKYLAFICIIFVSCSSNTIETFEEFNQWINDKNNGLVKTKNVNEFRLEMKVLPPEYLAYNEKGTDNSKDIDSLIGYYSNYRTFLFTLKYKNTEGSAAMHDVYNYTDYKSRIMELNFRSKEYFKVKTAKGELPPVLSSFQDIQGISQDASFYLVFVDEENKIGLMEADKFSVVFSDYTFETGITHFEFEKGKIDNIPNLKFLK